ncbi:TetR family transcriptional regulator [Sphingobium sp. SCG-1]|uniref:TetR/AcrR family transcriptional regulator n=1 Tax=Sphingobium sp. SCG-1 TaxID=2072936 RepID=UPI000CD68868|nr:TetR/AcrR family transcriptional regulator [Sphingobium sp. SCG-1]AUW57274.1 TetR family transcriptional regulator [Sphingobium sp. SCG-1]
MTMVENDIPSTSGLRERKRQETQRRITDAGICLFIEKGIDATTLDEIAAMAGISRRTFFHYFKSKDDILISLQKGLGGMIAGRIRQADEDALPLDAIRASVIGVCAEVPADDMVAIDRLMRSSPAVQARKQASYVEQERILFAALSARWPDPARGMALRLIAMLAIGAIRLATEALSQEGERRSLIELLNAAFDALTSELAGERFDDRPNAHPV